MRLVQVDLLGKDVCGLTDRTNDIVSLCGLFARQVLYLVIGLIERRTNEVGKASIDDTELLGATLLNI